MSVRLVPRMCSIGIRNVALLTASSTRDRLGCCNRRRRPRDQRGDQLRGSSSVRAASLTDVPDAASFPPDRESGMRGSESGDDDAFPRLTHMVNPTSCALRVSDPSCDRLSRRHHRVALSRVATPVGLRGVGSVRTAQSRAPVPPNNTMQRTPTTMFLGTPTPALVGVADCER